MDFYHLARAAIRFSSFLSWGKAQNGFDPMGSIIIIIWAASYLECVCIPPGVSLTGDTPARAVTIPAHPCPFLGARTLCSVPMPLSQWSLPRCMYATTTDAHGPGPGPRPRPEAVCSPGSVYCRQCPSPASSRLGRRSQSSRPSVDRRHPTTPAPSHVRHAPSSSAARPQPPMPCPRQSSCQSGPLRNQAGWLPCASNQAGQLACASFASDHPRQACQ